LRDVGGPANESGIRALFGWSRCFQNGSTAQHMFERCPFGAACLGAPNTDLEGKFENGIAMKDLPEGCNTAYRNDSDNFLCGGCAQGYSHTAGDGSGKCDECPLPGENEGIAVAGILFGIAGLFVYIKLTLGDGGKKDASDGVKSIGLSFVQIISLLTTFPIAWPPIFAALFQIGGAVTVLGQHLVNLKCMFPERSEAEVFYSTQLAWGLIPPLLVGACIVTWFVVDRVSSWCKARKITVWWCLRCCIKGTISNSTTLDVSHPPSLHTGQATESNEQPLTLHQKIFASNVALLYLIWPGLCSETFALFACRSLCGDVDRPRLRVDLTEICFKGRHLTFAYFLGAPMLLLYVIGLPMGALVMVWRLNRRAGRKKQAMDETIGHSTWGLFYSAFRNDTWWCVFPPPLLFFLFDLFFVSRCLTNDFDCSHYFFTVSCARLLIHAGGRARWRYARSASP
jgi:hypothetical protein